MNFGYPSLNIGRMRAHVKQGIIPVARPVDAFALEPPALRL
jgi:hypothetical protein